VRASVFLVLATACGRIAFDPLGSTSDGGDDGGGDDGGAGDDAATGLVPMRAQCQYVTTTTSPVSVLAATLQSSVLATDTIVVAIGFNSATTIVTSVTDNGGSVYSPITALQRGGAESQIMYLATAPAPGNETVMAMFSQPVINASLRVCAYARTDQSSALATLSTSGNGTFAASGVLMTSVPNSLLIAAVAGTSNAGLDFAFVTAINTMPLGHIVEERTAAAAGGFQVSASFGVTTDWVIQMIALQPR
jgi:hypothetical protein